MPVQSQFQRLRMVDPDGESILGQDPPVAPSKRSQPKFIGWHFFDRISGPWGCFMTLRFCADELDLC
jgi:hypothetical protein